MSTRHTVKISVMESAVFEKSGDLITFSLTFANQVMFSRTISIEQATAIKNAIGHCLPGDSK